MGYLLVIKKFVIIILVNIFLEILLLSLGGYFLMMTFLLGFANLFVIPFFCKKETGKQIALLSLILALLLTVIPILFAYLLFSDAAGVALMIFLTFPFVTIPLLLFSVFSFFRKQKGEKQN